MDNFVLILSPQSKFAQWLIFHLQTRWTVVRCTWARLPSRAATRPSPATTTATCRPVLPQDSVVSIQLVRISAEGPNPQYQDSIQHPHRDKDLVNTLCSKWPSLPTYLPTASEGWVEIIMFSQACVCPVHRGGRWGQGRVPLPSLSLRPPPAIPRLGSPPPPLPPPSWTRNGYPFPPPQLDQGPGLGYPPPLPGRTSHGQDTLRSVMSLNFLMHIYWNFEGKV